ncbi:MAG TPA: YceI family protein [Phnomibacter sp.]|nr:YceI family protein [Phnomibacter sp.]
MKRFLLASLAVLLLHSAHAQIWFTKTGAISFFSHTEMEDIEAANNEAVSIIDAAKGEFSFQVLIKGFKFPKTTMQEHFNGANYMNSDKFPKAEFKGKLVKPAAVNFKKDGVYTAEVEGDMTMHGITKKMKATGKITITKGVPSVQATFKVNRTDFGIKVPSFTAAKIAEAIDITVQCKYEPYK